MPRSCFPVLVRPATDHRAHTPTTTLLQYPVLPSCSPEWQVTADCNLALSSTPILFRHRYYSPACRLTCMAGRGMAQGSVIVAHCTELCPTFPCSRRKCTWQSQRVEWCWESWHLFWLCLGRLLFVVGLHPLILSSNWRCKVMIASQPGQRK